MKKNVYLFSKPDLCTKLRSKHCTTALCYIIISKMKEMKRSVIRKFNRHNVDPWTDKKNGVQTIPTTSAKFFTCLKRPREEREILTFHNFFFTFALIIIIWTEAILTRPMLILQCIYSKV